ncbi:MAG: hypothetical protein WA231_06695 [Methylocella sp.]
MEEKNIELGAAMRAVFLVPWEWSADFTGLVHMAHVDGEGGHVMRRVGEGEDVFAHYGARGLLAEAAIIGGGGDDGSCSTMNQLRCCP